jgi:2-methylcitrate dehydratase
MHGIFPRYKGKFEALLSTHYAVAVILHDRELTLSQFEPERYNDPKLKSFSADNVEVREDASLTGVQSIVEAEMADGRTVKVRCDTPRGSPENRLTRGQIEAKFRTYARGVLAPARIDEVVTTVARLEDLASAGKLMDLLRREERGGVRKSAAA